QRVCRTALEIGEVRGGLSVRLRQRRRGARVAWPLSRFLQRQTSTFEPWPENAGRGLLQPRRHSGGRLNFPQPSVCRNSSRATPSLHRDKRSAILYKPNEAEHHLSFAGSCSDNRDQFYVVQEALIVVYRRVGTIRSPAALAGWLLTVIARLCMLPALMLMRGVEELASLEESRELAKVPPDELRIDLVNAIESLSPSHREVLLLRDLEDLTIWEIAGRLGVTREAAKSRLRRARTLGREDL